MNFLVTFSLRLRDKVVGSVFVGVRLDILLGMIIFRSEFSNWD